MKKLILVLVLLSVLLPTYGQQAGDDHSRELTWGVNTNTNSGLVGGLVFKLALQRQNNTYSVFGLEFINVRHPQELKYRSDISNSTFIWGKQNHLYSIRGQYGREVILFKKAQQQGVQVSGIFSGGPTIGVIAPYYILFDGEYQPYDPMLHSIGGVQGSGRIFQGLGESEITFGLNAKAGLSFEFGAFRNSVAGLEVGVSMEAFPKEIILVPTQDNSAVFTALYFNIYWGTRR